MKESNETTTMGIVRNICTLFVLIAILIIICIIFLKRFINKTQCNNNNSITQKAN